MLLAEWCSQFLAFLLRQNNIGNFDHYISATEVKFSSLCNTDVFQQAPFYVTLCSITYIAIFSGAANGLCSWCDRSIFRSSPQIRWAFVPSPLLRNLAWWWYPSGQFTGPFPTPTCDTSRACIDQSFTENRSFSSGHSDELYECCQPQSKEKRRCFLLVSRASSSSDSSLR